jgi:hypothetical protein
MEEDTGCQSAVQTHTPDTAHAGIAPPMQSSTTSVSESMPRDQHCVSAPTSSGHVAATSSCSTHATQIQQGVSGPTQSGTPQIAETLSEPEWIKIAIRVNYTEEELVAMMD